MFDIEEFVAECQVAIKEAEPRLAIREALRRAVRDPEAVARALPATRAEVVPLYTSEDLTVMKVVWAPKMSFAPHNHLMWAAIGLYGGEEDNTFYRRAESGIAVSGGKTLYVGDVVVLGDDAIHGVANPRQEYTAALHVYGGNLPACSRRSEWDETTFEEKTFDFERIRRYFEDANSRSGVSPA